MNKKIGRSKLSVSLPHEMHEWLKEEAARDLDDISGIIRKHLLPAMRKDIPASVVIHQTVNGDNNGKVNVEKHIREQKKVKK